MLCQTQVKNTAYLSELFCGPLIRTFSLQIKGCVYRLCEILLQNQSVKHPKICLSRFPLIEQAQ